MVKAKTGKKKDKVDSKDELENFKNQLARALADYDNLKKRVEKEKEEYRKFANLILITKLLPVFDMLEDAQKHLNDSGLAITMKEFAEVLEEEGVQRINAKEGEQFDENLHEAVEVVKGSKKEDGKIVEEIMSGWKYEEGRAIRPAKVKVYGKERK